MVASPEDQKFSRQLTASVVAILAMFVILGGAVAIRAVASANEPSETNVEELEAIEGTTAFEGMIVSDDGTSEPED